MAVKLFSIHVLSCVVRMQVCGGGENQIRSAHGGDLVALKWLSFKLQKS